jgi:signal transduction histidine kinase
MFRSTSTRLAALYTCAFVVAVAALGWITLATTRAALTAQFDGRIAAESAALTQSARKGGFAAVAREVAVRERLPGTLEYGLQNPQGLPVAGRLANLVVADGWSTPAILEGRGESDPIRVQALALPGGGRLLVGDDLDAIEDLDGLIVQRLALALTGMVLLGVAGGYLLSRDVGRRMSAISHTAEAIIGGDMHRRIPVRGASHDLDRLAGTLNRMLDRIAALMESLRQVSNDIAHDLRTPLTRLRQRLEGLLAEAEAGRTATLEAAIADLDAALETFAALLRIAQIEGGARRSAFQRVDLARIADDVVEAFTPAAQDSGHELALQTVHPAQILGDRELLTQMIANLVENSLRHTPAGSHIRVEVTGASVMVRDDGPGVAETDRAHLFDRFYRAERSRSTPGSGLGLALVAAVASLHDATLEISEAGPGLAVGAIFAPAAELH